MVKIRLLRTGTKKQAKYRIIVIDQQKKRDGASIEILGNYDPTQNPAFVKLDIERYSYWTEKGAQPTKTIRDIFKKYGKTS